MTELGYETRACGRLVQTLPQKHGVVSVKYVDSPEVKYTEGQSAKSIELEGEAQKIPSVFCEHASLPCSRPTDHSTSSYDRGAQFAVPHGDRPHAVGAHLEAPPRGADHGLEV